MSTLATDTDATVRSATRSSWLPPGSHCDLHPALVGAGLHDRQRSGRGGLQALLGRGAPLTRGLSQAPTITVLQYSPGTAGNALVLRVVLSRRQQATEPAPSLPT